MSSSCICLVHGVQLGEVTIQVSAQDVSTEAWWNGAMQGRSKSLARRAAAILMCTAWNFGRKEIDVFFRDYSPCRQGCSI
jgi:hypothetical protein